MLISPFWNYFSKSSATISRPVWLFDMVQSTYILLTWADFDVLAPSTLSITRFYTSRTEHKSYRKREL